jgi:hypothetical protein
MTPPGPQLRRVLKPARLALRIAPLFLAALFLGAVDSPRTHAATPAPGVPTAPEPPRLLMALPPALEVGRTQVLQLRGLFLTNVSAVLLTNLAPTPASTKAPPQFPLRIRTVGPAEVPKDTDAKRAGDTRIELELTPEMPASAPASDGVALALVAISPAGASAPLPVRLLPAGSVTTEREPNGGFRQAQGVSTPVRHVLGAIQEAGDVDVFKVSVRAGQSWTATVFAAAHGSLLDALLTVHDTAGRVLVANDDLLGAAPTTAAAGRRDAAVRWVAPGDGEVYVTVQDANDKGGAVHPYVLQLEGSPIPTGARR